MSVDWDSRSRWFEGEHNKVGDLFLRALSLPQVHLAECWLQGLLMSTNHSSWRVAPLEDVVHPKGYIVQKKHKKQVAPLEHVVHPEGHVVQKKQMRRVAPLEHVVRPKGNIALSLMKEQT